MENELSEKKGLHASWRESLFGFRTKEMSGRTKKLSLMGVLAALMIVFERTIYIPVGDSSRYSLTFIVVFITGLVLGGIDSALVAGVADLVGALIAGYTPNPLITVCVMLSAFLCGLCLYSDRSYVKLAVAIVLDQALCSLLLKSAAFAIWYGGSMATYPKYFKIRLVQFSIMTPVEFVVLFILYRLAFGRIKKLTNDFLR